jgi:hypothetical protein
MDWSAAQIGDAPILAHAARTQQRKIKYLRRYFIAWDGEGVGGQVEQDQLPKDVAPQVYVLFGCSAGPMITGRDLGTIECLDLMFDVKHDHPNALHISFAFDYDVNMILKDLSPQHFFILGKTGQVKWNGYRIEHVPHKWFSVSRPLDNGKREMIKIMDIFSFFQKSFIKACESYIPEHELMKQFTIIQKGKKARSTFTHDQLPMITEYWTVEIALLEALAVELRNLMEQAGFKISSWHGPGALANFVYRTHGIAKHKINTPELVQDAAQFAYSAGRFELYRMGRHVGPVYSCDLNSAYPAAIAQLPSLTEGIWRRNPFVTLDDLAEFGMYKIELRALSIKKPNPLFHRSEHGSITYPSRVSGWYWTPEVAQLVAHLDPRAFRIVDAWEYVGWSTRPFDQFVHEYYAERKRLKALGIGAERAIKLALNSLYGKMAQRVGWERTGGPPTWHQLEWAGWVTSWTRAKLFDVLARIPWHDQIAVETDGIYTTANPVDLGIVDSKELGGWEVNVYDELLYLQSGVYALRTGETWDTKYRGLNSDALNAEGMGAYLSSCIPGEWWPPITGPDTRFTGYQISLARSRTDHSRFYDQHRRWVTIPKEISVGNVGKRVHRHCPVCKEGLTPYEKPHDLTVASTAFKDWNCYPHFIPWRDQLGREAEWRTLIDQEEGLLK